jgi:hypothetical protein
MLNSALLDVVIGLAFIYLLLSLVLSSWTELVAGVFKLRNSHLDHALSKEILGSDDFVALFYKHPLIRTYKSGSNLFYRIMKRLGFGKLYSLIARGRPSYVNALDFGQIMADLLDGGIGGIEKRYAHLMTVEEFEERGEKKVRYNFDGELINKANIEDGLKRFDYFREFIPRVESLKSFSESISERIAAATDGSLQNFSDDMKVSLSGMVNRIDRFLEKNSERNSAVIRLANYFDNQMARVAGGYKRRVNWLLVVFGLFMSAALNADTIMIAQILWNDPVTREAAVREASEMFREDSLSAIAAAADLNTRLVDSSECEGCLKPSVQTIAESVRKISPFPIGWEGVTSLARQDIRTTPVDLKGWIYKIFGIFITTLLISLGAPFWFDMLSKFVNIRNVGVKPQSVDSGAAGNK